MRKPQKCPVCLTGTVHEIGNSHYFCLDCDWDTLKPLPPRASAAPKRRRNAKPPRWIDIDAEWYFKTQLRKYRKWKDSDFMNTAPDYIHTPKIGYTTHYFYRDTVAAHEATPFFRDRPRRQVSVPDNEQIHVLAYDLTVRGRDLIRAGWTVEMIDKLPIHREHRWRHKRIFLLADLKQVSDVYHIGNTQKKQGGKK